MLIALCKFSYKCFFKKILYIIFNSKLLSKYFFFNQICIYTLIFMSKNYIKIKNPKQKPDKSEMLLIYLCVNFKDKVILNRNDFERKIRKI